jgi:hypothetical protein
VQTTYQTTRSSPRHLEFYNLFTKCRFSQHIGYTLENFTVQHRTIKSSKRTIRHYVRSSENSKTSDDGRLKSVHCNRATIDATHRWQHLTTADWSVFTAIALRSTRRIDDAVRINSCNFLIVRQPVCRKLLAVYSTAGVNNGEQNQLTSHALLLSGTCFITSIDARLSPAFVYRHCDLHHKQRDFLVVRNATRQRLYVTAVTRNG